MHLLEPVFSASFLNDKGDIVAALNRTLVIIQADTYQFLTADEMASLVTEHAKSQHQQQPGQPLSPAAVNAQRAAMQLMQTGSKTHQALVRQTTVAQVTSSMKSQLLEPICGMHLWMASACCASRHSFLLGASKTLSTSSVCRLFCDQVQLTPA